MGLEQKHNRNLFQYALKCILNSFAGKLPLLKTIFQSHPILGQCPSVEQWNCLTDKILKAFSSLSLFYDFDKLACGEHGEHHIKI